MVSLSLNSTKVTAFFSKITRGEWVNPGHDNFNVKTTSPPLKMKPNLLRIDAKIKVIIIQVLSHINMTWHVTPSPPLTIKPNLFSHQGHDNFGVVTPSPPLHVRTNSNLFPNQGHEYLFLHKLGFLCSFQGELYYITPNQLSEKLGAALIVWRGERG